MTKPGARIRPTPGKFHRAERSGLPGNGPDPEDHNQQKERVEADAFSGPSPADCFSRVRAYSLCQNTLQKRSNFLLDVFALRVYFRSPMKLALSNPTGPVFILTPELMEEGLKASRQSPRGRMLLPIHRHQDDLVQRMINFLQPGTYIQAHHHPRDWATETILVTAGCLGFVVFDDKGEVLSTHRLGPGEMIDIEARVWHGVLALAKDTVILEIKRGPYNEEDKVFADWSPPEFSEEAPAYLEWLTGLFPLPKPSAD